MYDLQLAEVSVRRALGHRVRFVSGFGKVRILTAVQSRHHFQRKQQPRYLHAHHTGPACWVAVASHAPYFLHLSFMWWLRRDYPVLYALQVLADYCPTVELSVTTLKRTANALFHGDPEVQITMQ